MKKFRFKIEKTAVFALIMAVCMNLPLVGDNTDRTVSKAIIGPPVKTLFAAEDTEKKEGENSGEEDESERNKQNEEVKDAEDREADNEKKEEGKEEETEVLKSQGKTETVNGSEADGRPELILSFEKSETEPLEFQTIKASYKEFKGNKVTQICWGVDTGGDTWQSVNDPGAMSLDVYSNSIVFVSIRTDNGYMTYDSIRTRNIDESCPVLDTYDGQEYQMEMLGDTVNNKTKAVKIKIHAVDNGLGMPEKPYCCTNIREYYVPIYMKQKKATEEQLSKVDWQADGEFTITENGKYYFLARDVLNNSSNLILTIDCIDKECPSTTVTQEYTEADGYISQNMIIADSRDVGGAGLADKPYSWNSGEWTDENTFTVRDNCTVTLDVKDALDNIEHTEIVIKDHKYDNEGPVISRINTVSGDVYNNYTGNVWIKIEAEDKKISMAPEGYSFDGGETWQSQPIKNVTANGRFKIAVRDALLNETEGEEVVIKNIDEKEPEIDRIHYTLQGVKNGYAKSALITVDAEDGQSGLSRTAYSFDAGGTYQEENTYTAQRNGNFNIYVSDAVHNVAKKNITVSGIDCTAPVIEVTGNPSGTVYKSVTLDVKATDTESGIASLWYKNDTVNIPSAIYQAPEDNGAALANAQAVINTNGDYTFYAYDEVGNVTETRVTVSKITKKKTQNTDSDDSDSSESKSSDPSKSASKTIVLPPSTTSTVTTETAVSRTSDRTNSGSGEIEEAKSGKTIVLKGSASSNSEGSDEEQKGGKNKADGDFALEFEEAGEGDEDILPEALDPESMYEGGVISVENTEYDSIVNEAGPKMNGSTEEAASEKLLKSAGGTPEKKTSGPMTVLIVLGTGVLGAGGTTIGVLIKKGILKIPDFFG